MGEAVWFKVHKIAMSTTVVLGLLGLVPVLVDRGVDPIRRMEYHPMVGLATLAIALAQPAVAYLRPGKVGGRRARPPGAPLTPLAPLAPRSTPGAPCSTPSTPPSATPPSSSPSPPSSWWSNYPHQTRSPTWPQDLSAMAS